MIDWLIQVLRLVHKVPVLLINFTKTIIFIKSENNSYKTNDFSLPELRYRGSSVDRVSLFATFLYIIKDCNFLCEAFKLPVI